MSSLACRAAVSASVVTAEAVMQDGGRPVRVGHRDSLSASLGLGDGRLDQRRGLGEAASQRREHHRGQPGGARPGRRADRVGLGDQGRGGREVTAGRDGRAQGVQHDRQLVEHAGRTGEPDLPDEQRAPGVVVPQRAGGRLGQPAPAGGLPPR